MCRIGISRLDRIGRIKVGLVPLGVCVCVCVCVYWTNCVMGVGAEEEDLLHPEE